jgi:FtsH-binding integral membrane protein
MKEMTVTDVTDELKNEERERTKEEIDSFLTRESRNSFIVRVYSILTVQLLLVALSVLLFGRYPMLGGWMLTKGSFGKYVCVCHVRARVSPFI